MVWLINREVNHLDSQVLRLVVNLLETPVIKVTTGLDRRLMVEKVLEIEVQELEIEGWVSELGSYCHE